MRRLAINLAEAATVPRTLMEIFLASAPTCPLDILRAAPEEIHPALALAWALHERERREGPLTTEALLEIAPAIDAALTAGEASLAWHRRGLEVLRAATPAPASIVPEGF